MDEGRNGATTALITGATGGIGGAIARRLAREGVRIIVTGRDGVKASALAGELRRETGADCLGVSLDVTSPGSLDALPAAIEDFGEVDWLVNNAGVAETAPVLSAENQPVLRRMMEVNFYGPLRLFGTFGPRMVERGAGRVVQIASSASLVGYAYVTAYCSTKHALLGWTRAAALECAPKGVGLSAICPHYVDSPLTDRNIEKMKAKTGRSEEDLRAFVAAQNPGGVIVTPEEVADATYDVLNSDRGGLVVELPGGERNVVDEGIALGPRDAAGGR